MTVTVINAEQVAKLVESGDTLLIGGSGAGHSVPDTLIAYVWSGIISRPNVPFVRLTPTLPSPRDAVTLFAPINNTVPDAEVV